MYHGYNGRNNIFMYITDETHATVVKNVTDVTDVTDMIDACDG